MFEHRTLFISVNLLFQRRRSAEDELTMREYLQEGDLISVTHGFYVLLIAISSRVFSVVACILSIMSVLLFFCAFRQKCSPSSQMEPCHFTPVV